MLNSPKDFRPKTFWILSYILKTFRHFQNIFQDEHKSASNIYLIMMQIVVVEWPMYWLLPIKELLEFNNGRHTQAMEWSFESKSWKTCNSFTRLAAEKYKFWQQIMHKLCKTTVGKNDWWWGPLTKYCIRKRIQQKWLVKNYRFTGKKVRKMIDWLLRYLKICPNL